MSGGDAGEMFVSIESSGNKLQGRRKILAEKSVRFQGEQAKLPVCLLNFSYFKFQTFRTEYLSHHHLVLIMS